MDFLQNHIEALIFCSSSPVKVADIKACLSEMFNAEVPEEDIAGAIQRVEEKFTSEEFSFQLFKSAGGYQFLTKPAYQASIGIMLKQQSKKRLSTSAMETLSIIAYKQPISKTELENIRGVNCDYAVQKLLDKGLIEITGKAETIGRPMLYGTTVKFMEYFGINDLGELPVPKEFSETNTIGINPEMDGDADADSETDENSELSETALESDSQNVLTPENELSEEMPADGQEQDDPSDADEPSEKTADPSPEPGTDLTDPDAKT